MKKITLINSKKKFEYNVFLKKSYFAFSILFLLFNTPLFSQSYTTNGPYLLKDCVPWEGRGTNAMHVFGGGPGECKGWGMDMVREWIDMKMTSIAKMRQMADEAKANGQVIILAGGWFDHTDFGGGTPWPNCQMLGANPQQDWRWGAVQQRWREIATEFKNDSHVWFGIWNEPYSWDGGGGYNDNMWRDDAIAMINNARGTGAQNIIVIAGSHMGQGHDVIRTHGPAVMQGQKNVIFDIHIYNHKWSISEADVDQRMQGIFNAGVAVMIGEFGNNGDDIYHNTIPVCEKRRISGLAWLWGQYGKSKPYQDAVWNYTTGTRLAPTANPGCGTGCSAPIITAYTNVNNAGWAPKDAEALCEGGTVEFGPWPIDANGWTWTGPNNFTSSVRHVTLTNVKANQSGTYTATYDDGKGCPASKNFSLTVNAPPTVTAVLNVNNTGWVQKDSAVLCPGGTVAFGPHPWQDPNGWTWTGPNNYSASTREITLNNMQVNQSGIYTATYNNGSACGSTSKKYYITVSCTTTGINSLPNGNTISIYPNPFNNNFNIIISSEIILKDCMIRIYDVCGKQVRTSSITDHETVIDRADLQSGLYFYSIINGDTKIANGKIIVQD